MLNIGGRNVQIMLPNNVVTRLLPRYKPQFRTIVSRPASTFLKRTYLIRERNEKSCERTTQCHLPFHFITHSFVPSFQAGLNVIRTNEATILTSSPKGHMLPPSQFHVTLRASIVNLYIQSTRTNNVVTSLLPRYRN